MVAGLIKVESYGKSSGQQTCITSWWFMAQCLHPNRNAMLQVSSYPYSYKLIVHPSPQALLTSKEFILKKSKSRRSDSDPDASEDGLLKSENLCLLVTDAQCVP